LLGEQQTTIGKNAIDIKKSYADFFCAL